MTTVIAVEHEDGVTFAADSRVSSGSLSDGWCEKVVRNGRFAFAAAGYLRTIQILEYAKLPDAPEGEPGAIDRFVTLELVPAIKAAFKDVGNEDSFKGSIVIAAVRGRVYEITSDGAWTRNPSGYYAVGSGSSYALGALEAGARPKRAIKIAAKYDSGTNDDVRITEVAK